MAFDANIQLGGLTLEFNPEQHIPHLQKMGQFARTVGGGIVNIDMSNPKLSFQIKGITVTQFNELLARTAVNKRLSFIDYVPIAEASPTREILEMINTVSVEGTTVYVYVPKYYVFITDFQPNFKGGLIDYTMNIEEV